MMHRQDHGALSAEQAAPGHRPFGDHKGQGGSILGCEPAPGHVPGELAGLPEPDFPPL